MPKQTACPDCGGELKHLGENVSGDTGTGAGELQKSFGRCGRNWPRAVRQDRASGSAESSNPAARNRGPGLLAHVLASKYTRIICRCTDNRRFTLGREWSWIARPWPEWVGGCSRLLEPLLSVTTLHVMSAGKLHADDTPVPEVVAPGNGKTRRDACGPTCEMTSHRESRVRRRCGYAYTPDRKGEHPQSHPGVHGYVAGGCLRRVRCGLRRETSEGSRVYGACAQALLRTVRSS